MIEEKESNRAQLIVIHGIGGIGKTTLAKVIYNRLLTRFQHCSYLPNIRERFSQQNFRPEDLQKQLISNLLGQPWPHEISHVDEGVSTIKDRLKGKKILILFDDVDVSDRLDALAREPSWFESGSILIITTRNKDILKKWKERLLYELNGLDSSHSFQLFCKHAFEENEEHGRNREFDTIAKKIVDTTGGLPLAIEVIGSMLFGKSKDYWEGVFEKLQEIPRKEVQEILKISYDALDHQQKQIFLDIACLSTTIREKGKFAYYMWEDKKFFPREGIDKLISLSLIKMEEPQPMFGRKFLLEVRSYWIRQARALIDGKQLTIHDQLKDLGMAIVRDEGLTELRNRSRLWIEEEGLKAIETTQGIAKIEALEFCFSKWPYYVIKSEQFKGLIKLRFLKLSSVDLEGDFENLLLELRWLQWHSCCVHDFPATNFHLPKLVVLELPRSNITVHWNGWDQIKLAKNLKALNLERCDRLTSTPDLSAFEKLEVLNLRYCSNLKNIDPSVCKLNKTLQTLDVRGCSNLENLPIEMGEMEELRELLVDETKIREIPISEGFMKKLEILSARSCSKLCQLPNSIGSLVNLVTLSLDNCTSLKSLPEVVWNLKSLTELTFRGTTVKELPNSIGELNNLRLLGIRTNSIEMLPAIICKLTNLKELRIHYESHGTNVMMDIASLKNLEYLSIWGGPSDGNDNVDLFLELPSSLKQLDLSSCHTLRALPSLYNCKMLSFLRIERCPNLSKLCDNMGDAVKYCELRECDALERLPRLSNAKNLETLIVQGCNNLTEIQGLDSVWCLNSLMICSCPSLERLGDLSYLRMLTSLHLSDCEKLRDFDGINEQTSLQELTIDGCSLKISTLDLSKLKNLEELVLRDCEFLKEIRLSQKLENFPDISSFTSLKQVWVDGCEKLTEIEGLQEQKNLILFDLSYPDSLKTLDFSFTNLKYLFLKDYEKLPEIKGLPMSLMFLDISGCRSMENLPDLSRCCRLEVLHAAGCNTLTKIMGLQGQKELKTLDLSGCKSLKNFPNFSLFTKLKHLNLNGCEKLAKIEGLPMSLEILDISGCKLLENSLDFSQCHSLKGLLAEGCSKLTNIMGLQSSCLSILDLSDCKSLEYLHFSENHLRHLNLKGCEKLTEVKGQLEFWETSDTSGCKSLVNLPDLSRSENLTQVLAKDITPRRKMTLTINHEGICWFPRYRAYIIESNFHDGSDPKVILRDYCYLNMTEDQ